MDESPFLRSSKTKRSPEGATQDNPNKRILSPDGDDDLATDKRSRFDSMGNESFTELDNNPDFDIITRDEELNPKRRALLARGLAATDNLKRLATNCEKSAKSMTVTRAKTMLETVMVVEDIMHELSEIAFGNYISDRTLEKIEKSIENLKLNQCSQGKPTYAETARNKPNGMLDKEAKRVLLIYPKEGSNGTSEGTRDRVKELIQPKQLKLRVSRVNKIRNGGIVMEVDASQADKVKDIIKDELDIKKPQKRRPQVKIFDVPKDTSDEELSKVVYEQNFTESDLTETEFGKNFKPLYKTGPRNEKHTQWVVEVSPKLRNVMTQNGRIYYEWSSLKVIDYFSISRCYKCQRFGHMAKDCKGPETCGHCANEGHSYKDCPNKKLSPKCVNCQRNKLTNTHATNSEKCLTYVREKRRIQDKIGYEF